MWFESAKLIEKKAVPMFNESFPSIYSGMVNRPSSYVEIDFWIERTPEAIAILSAIITDMKPHSYRFTGPNYKRDEALDFCSKNNFSEELGKSYWDWLLYGDGYLWKGKLTEEQIKSNYDTAYKKAAMLFYLSNGVQYKSDVFNPLDFKDEDDIKELKHVPANTMNIDHDKKKITQFRQIVGVNEIKWNPIDIIHAKLLTMKGKVYGFSPIQSCLTEMNTLGYLKDYAGTFFKNGGVPDWMFILPKEMAGSKNHKSLIQMIQKYKHPSNKHGNLVFTGEVEPTQLNKFDKDMEFRQLAVYLTGVLALAFNMPMSRVASIIGSEVRISTGADDLANEGYWNKIDELQTYWEGLLNSQLFEPQFGVKIKFDRGYKQNEVREVQRQAMAAAYVSEVNMLLARQGKQVNLEYIKRTFFLDESDLMKGKKVDDPMPAQNKPNQVSKDQKGPGRQAYSKEKESQVSRTQDTSGS